MQEEQHRGSGGGGASSQFSIEMILPSAVTPPNKVQKDEPLDTSPPGVHPVKTSSDQAYRPCLMVADTSDQSQDCGASKKVRRPRTCFSDEQLKELERRFRINKYVSVADRSMLCSELGLTDSQIKTWFQNRRTKWKRLNEARYNLLSGAVDERLLRKESSYYPHPGVTIPSFQNKSSDQDVSPPFSAPHNLYSPFSHSFNAFPNYMWNSSGSYPPVYNSPGTVPAISTTSSQHAPLTVLTPLQSGPLHSTSLQSDSQCHGVSLSSSTSHNPISSEQEVSSSVPTQFHNLYPTSNKSASAYPGPKSTGLQSAMPPPDSTYTDGKESGLCGAPYSPYYNPCVDKSALRSHYQTALT